MSNAHGTIKSYLIGFILSITLTIIPFMLVANQLFSTHNLILALTLAAVLQLFVQSVFFLHLNTSSEARWNLLTFIFMIIVVLILVGGSLWIIYHMNYNMLMR